MEELEVNIITTISSRSKGIEGRNRNKIPENINSPNEMQIMRMCNWKRKLIYKLFQSRLSAKVDIKRDFHNSG